MATITTLNHAGAFTDDTLNQVNTNFTNQNTQLANLAAGTGISAGVLTGAQMVNGTVTSTQLDPQTIQYVTVTPTLAAFLAMYTTGIPLVAAQGAGTFIECLSVLINLGYGSAAFAAGAAVGAYIGTTAAGTLVTTAFAASIFTTFTANKIATTYAAALGSTADASGILNTGLVLSCPTQVFTGGTGATISIKVAYRVHTGLV